MNDFTILPFFIFHSALQNLGIDVSFFGNAFVADVCILYEDFRRFDEPSLCYLKFQNER
jgi:hypothetical protein